MKCYKLNSKAQASIKGFLVAIFIVIVGITFIFGIVAYPLVLLGAESSIVFCMIGTISWTIMLSAAAIRTKRWLQANIEEC